MITHQIMLRNSLFKYLKRLLFDGVGRWEYAVSSDQNINSWTTFTAGLEGQVTDLEFAKLNYTELFDAVLRKSTIRNLIIKAVRFLTCFLFLLGVGVIFFAVFSLPEQIDWRIYIPILSSVLLACWLAYQTDSRSELTRERYMNSMTENNRPIAIKTFDAMDKILDKHTFAFRDRAGVFKDLPPEFINAENILLFFLGEEKHRAAIPFSGPYPRGPLYISKAKPTPHSRPKGEILEYLKDKARVQELYNFVVSYDGKDPVAPHRKLSVARKNWMAAHEVLLKDFPLWLKVESRKATDKETQKFEKDLSVALSGNDEVKDYPSYRDFIKGKNTDFRNWYVELLKVMNAN